MTSKHTFSINGKLYDSISGLPMAQSSSSTNVAPSSPAASETLHSRTPVHAKQAHGTPQRSTTLRRDVLKKPVSKTQVGSHRRKPATGHVAKSDLISRFAPHPQPIQPISMAAQPAAAPAMSMGMQGMGPAISKPQSSVLNSRTVRQAIKPTPAPAATEPSTVDAKAQRRGLLSSKPRVASFLMAVSALVVLGGYFTYLNLPGLSVRVAAAQADVAASYPDYSPDGYRFNGPVAFSPGQVSINFMQNGGTGKYTVTEQKSTWDSQTVFDNVVARAADNSYVTNSQQGLTIYTYKGKAAWVNKGILYTISGDAPLSNEQLLRIAGSL
ncbi:MAG TPA: DUF4367 domain-containing protein [Candidatus Saccharimonadales bacterium]|jgi:hypothetical protein